MHIEIRSINDIPEALEFIKPELKPNEIQRIPQIQYEIEIELAFAQWDHLQVSDTLSTFPGIEEQTIHLCIERGLHKPISEYPRTIQKPEPTTKSSVHVDIEPEEHLPEQNRGNHEEQIGPHESNKRKQRLYSTRDRQK